ncbi:50S ribosomal protein L19e [Candidatus Woesearchaeota archaeon]|nr:50S ribosomal protein L19e [Candidatus Woesearchaeota archaeon]
MKLKTQRRIAAQILKVGTGKIWFDPEKLGEIKEAITKSDIRSLIRLKIIKLKKLPQQSKARARKIKLKKRKGLRSGQGSRKGKKTARMPRKKVWIAKIRTQRAFLRSLKEKNLIDNNSFRDMMAKAKGGFFRNKRHIRVYLQESEVLKKKNG